MQSDLQGIDANSKVGGWKAIGPVRIVCLTKDFIIEKNGGVGIDSFKDQFKGCIQWIWKVKFCLIDPFFGFQRRAQSLVGLLIWRIPQPRVHQVGDDIPWNGSGLPNGIR